MRKYLVAILLLGMLASTAFGNGRKGGIEDYDFQPETEPTDKMALESALKHIQTKNENLKYKGVHSCKSQIVAGIKYYLTLNFLSGEDKLEQYEFIIYVRPWENFIEVQEANKLDDHPEASSDLSKNLELKRLIQRFLSEQVKARVNTDLSAFEVEGIEVLEHKIVSGDLYKIVVTFTSGEQVKEYLVEVWSRPWLSPSLELSSVKDYRREVPILQKGIPKTLRAENTAGGFAEASWDNQGEFEQLILVEVKKYISNIVKSENIEIYDVYDVQTKALAVVHYKFTISYSINGKAKKQAIFQLTLNPRSKNVKIDSFQHATEQKPRTKDGGYSEYNWDPKGEIEIKVLDFLHRYGRAEISDDFEILKIIHAQSKVVNGVIFKLDLSYKSAQVSLNATTEVYAQIWTDTYEILSFVKSRKLDL